MKVLGNIIWFLLVGLETCIIYFVLGLLWCLTIIGIPFGRQLFKMAGLVAFPFGKVVNTDFNAHPIANVIWIILFGWESAVAYCIAGAFFCVTIIGIPFGLQIFKLAQLVLMPFGAKVD